LMLIPFHSSHYQYLASSQFHLRVGSAIASVAQNITVFVTYHKHP